MEDLFKKLEEIAEFACSKGDENKEYLATASVLFSLMGTLKMGNTSELAKHIYPFNRDMIALIDGSERRFREMQ